MGGRELYDLRGRERGNSSRAWVVPDELLQICFQNDHQNVHNVPFTWFKLQGFQLVGVLFI